MRKIADSFLKIVDAFIGKELEFRVRLFNVLGIAGILISVIIAVFGIAKGEPLAMLLTETACFLLATALVVFTKMTGKYEIGYWVTIVGIFFVLFPMLFFGNGGYRSGMPSFFVFAVLFTVFMIDGVKAIVTAILELVLYAGICFYAYYNPESIQFMPTEFNEMTDVVLGFVVASISLGVTMLIHFKIYNDQQKKLITSQKRAMELSQIKTTFLANMSHEIRSPINVMIGMNEMIARETDSDQIANYSSNIENAGKILLALVNDILDFSKIESGKTELNEETYMLSELIDNLTLVGKEQSEKKGLRFEVQLDESAPSVLYGDVMHIKQIVINLISNAAKYTEYGTVTLKINVKEIPETNNILLRISVKDTGIGIDAENIENMFKAFTRHRKVSSIEGTGLGLAISKEFADVIGGEILVSSEVGVGSEFTLEVVQQVRNNVPISLNSNDSKNSLNEASFTAPAAKILVVDDSKMNIEVFKALLKRTLVKIDSANSGEECLKMIEKKEYDLIFLDYMMPEMNGIETFEEIRKRGIQTPVVALTANAIQGVKQTLLDAGFVEYISKPIRWQKLEAAVSRLLPKEMVMLNSGKLSDETDQSVYMMREALQPYGISVDEGFKYVSGDSGLYREMVDIFIQDFNANNKEVKKLFEERDFESLRYIIHSLKSKAGMVGALKLSQISAEMEAELNNRNEGLVEATFPLLMYLWDTAAKGFENCRLNISTFEG